VRWRVVIAVGLFIGVGQFGVLFVAMNTGLPAGLASVIAPLQPVFTIPLAVVALGERPSLRQVVGVSLAIAGLGTIALGRAHGVPLQAVALGVASAAWWGCGNVVTRAAKPQRPFSLLVWSSLAAPAPLLGLSLIFEGVGSWQGAASSISASGIIALAYVIVVSTFFGYGTWYWLMSRHPASTVAPFTVVLATLPRSELGDDLFLQRGRKRFLAWDLPGLRDRFAHLVEVGAAAGAVGEVSLEPLPLVGR
jgi:O-acetylserine/cysteine efflux transporter